MNFKPLDLNLLRWKSLAELIGLESGYRLERLSGRYLAVEQQNLHGRSVPAMTWSATSRIRDR